MLKTKLKNKFFKEVKILEKLVKLLKNKNKTISSMESCTGGMFASEVTNIDGSSEIFKLGLVTYSNGFKEYFGVSKETIDEYTVYSNEVSREMAKTVCDISKSDFAVGITGMLGVVDPNNKSDEINSVYISIYNKEKNKNFNYKIEAKGNSRKEKKKNIIEFVKERLYEICK